MMMYYSTPLLTLRVKLVRIQSSVKKTRHKSVLVNYLCSCTGQNSSSLLVQATDAT